MGRSDQPWLELLVGLELLATLQNGQVEVFVNLADVVLTGQHPVHVTVDGEPAVAFRIGARGIEFTRGLSKLLHQGWIGGRRSTHGGGSGKGAWDWIRQQAWADCIHSPVSVA